MPRIFEPREHVIDAELANGNLEAWRQVLGFPRRPKMCEECGVNPADCPRRICPGCDAYREHTGHF